MSCFEALNKWAQSHRSMVFNFCSDDQPTFDLSFPFQYDLTFSSVGCDEFLQTVWFRDDRGQIVQFERVEDIVVSGIKVTIVCGGFSRKEEDRRKYTVFALAS